jgi:hypothetical protein
MKSLIYSGILLLVMAAYLIIPVIPVIDYLINKDYIAKNLCVNRDKPKSCCKGKCHMVKQLQKTNKSADNNSGNTNPKVQIKDLSEFVIYKSCRISLQALNIGFPVLKSIDYIELAGSAVFVPPKPFCSTL